MLDSLNHPDVWKSNIGLLILKYVVIQNLFQLNDESIFIFIYLLTIKLSIVYILQKNFVYCGFSKIILLNFTFGIILTEKQI